VPTITSGRKSTIAWRCSVAALSVATAAAASLLALPAPAQAGAQPVGMAAPYEYLGWGSPPSPTVVMAASGVRDVTLAFVLSRGRCNPEWDGSRPLAGGVDAATIASIRAAGGDVAVSFGGWSGRKLGTSCRTAVALAAAYQRVIDSYGLKAIDVDIEHTEVSSATVRRRVIAALAAVQRADPGLEISITLGTNQNGPDPHGLSLIADAAAIGFQPTSWTIMPFDFGATAGNMGAASVVAAEALAADLASTYHESTAVAYGHMGISTMNGRTDEADETVTTADLRTMLSFAQSNHLARLTFWSVNRDRPCAVGSPASDSCSGIAQQPYAFTSVIAQFHG
jgi:hypothetical protein